MGAGMTAYADHWNYVLISCSQNKVIADLNRIPLGKVLLGICCNLYKDIKLLLSFFS